jgi:hypothetical protein
MVGAAEGCTLDSPDRAARVSVAAPPLGRRAEGPPSGDNRKPRSRRAGAPGRTVRSTAVPVLEFACS